MEDLCIGRQGGQYTRQGLRQDTPTRWILKTTSIGRRDNQTSREGEKHAQSST